MVEDHLVSVIMCVYNAGDYFIPALESTVHQTYHNLDIIIVDDGSTDGGVDSAMSIILNDPRIRLIRQANRGKAAAMNRALDEVRGEFYAVLDADDISYPERIEKQLCYLLQNPDVAGVFCGMDFIIGERHVAPYCEIKEREQCRREIAAFRLPGHDPTPMYRLSLVGNERFAENLLQAEGMDYILRVGEQYPLARIGGCLYSYRFHLQSLCKRDMHDRPGFVQAALSRACERRGLNFEQIFPHYTLPRAHADDGLMVQFLLSARTQKEQGLRLGALSTGFQAVALRPLSKEAWKALLYALTPVRVIAKVRDRHMVEIIDRQASLRM